MAWFHHLAAPLPATLALLQDSCRFPGHDANGRAVAYIYGDDRRRGVGDDGLTREEARQIAGWMAWSPELVRAKKPGNVRPGHPAGALALPWRCSRGAGCDGPASRPD